MKFLIIIFSLIIAACTSGTKTPSYPVNSSYNIESAFKKLKKSHPETQLAKSISQLKVWRNQTYKRIGQRRLQMDIYRLAGNRKQLRPGVILVHGGGWASGNRTMWYGLAEYLAELGYVTATVSYRLSPEAPFPASIHDVRESVRWLRKNAHKFGIDKKLIIIAGGSSGGQVASLVGLTSADAQLDEYASQSPDMGAVQGIINIDGLSSFTTPLALKHENDRPQPSPAGRWLGGSFEQVPEIWTQASPIQYVNASSPPMLFFRGERPRFTAGLSEIREKLDQNKVPNELIEFPEAPHSFWLFEPWVSKTANGIHQFVQTTLLR